MEYMNVLMPQMKKIAVGKTNSRLPTELKLFNVMCPLRELHNLSFIFLRLHLGVV